MICVAYTIKNIKLSMVKIYIMCVCVCIVCVCVLVFVSRVFVLVS